MARRFPETVRAELMGDAWDGQEESLPAAPAPSLRRRRAAPTKVEDFSVDEYREAKERGETDRAIAKRLGVGLSALHGWKRRHGLVGRSAVPSGEVAKPRPAQGLRASWEGEVDAGEAARLLRGLGDLAAAVPGRVRVSVEVVERRAST